MNRTPAIVGLLLVILAIIAGLIYHHQVQSHQDLTHTTQPPPSSQALPGTTLTPLKKGVIYTVDETQGQEANDYLVPKPIAFSSDNTAREAINALIAAPNSPLAVGTGLRGVKIADGVATVDFTHTPIDEMHGEAKQAQALNAILMTLGQFPNINSVQIEVNGAPLKSLGEEGDNSGPLKVIHPGIIQQAKVSGGA